MKKAVLNPVSSFKYKIIMTLFVVSMASLLAACKPSTPAATQEIPPLTVKVTTLATQALQDIVTLDGVVAPLQQASLVARVPGQLTSVNFKDGERIRKGQLLFTIEKPPYIEQLKLNQARLDQARADYERQSELLKENATSQASVETSLANLKQAKANVSLAQINLSYTDIRAPFDGIISRRTIDAGNYVGAAQGGTELAVLMQISPAYVNAAIGERDLLRIRAANPDKNPQSGVGRTKVRAQLQGDEAPSETGVLDFLDHKEVQTSGTIALRGLFENTNNHLIPGFYAKLSIDLGPQRQALVIPRAVIQSDQQGDYVFVVMHDHTVQRRTIKTAALPGEDIEVLSGLAAGEQLVVAGYAKLSNGQPVVVEAEPLTAAGK